LPVFLVKKHARFAPNKSKHYQEMVRTLGPSKTVTVKNKAGSICALLALANPNCQFVPRRGRMGMGMARGTILTMCEKYGVWAVSDAKAGTLQVSLVCKHKRKRHNFRREVIRKT
jgi:hypothetical protein